MPGTVAPMMEDAPEPTAEVDPASGDKGGSDAVADSSARSEDGVSDTEMVDDASQSDDDEGRPVQRIRDATATAIKRKRFGLAYHLARGAGTTAAIPDGRSVRSARMSLDPGP